MSELLKQRISQLEEDMKDTKEDVKDLSRQVANQNTSIAKIELIIQGLKTDWLKLEELIKGNIQESNTTAWKEVTIEAIKTIGIVAGVIAGAKILL